MLDKNSPRDNMGKVQILRWTQWQIQFQKKRPSEPSGRLCHGETVLTVQKCIRSLLFFICVPLFPFPPSLPPLRLARALPTQDCDAGLLKKRTVLISLRKISYLGVGAIWIALSPGAGCAWASKIYQIPDQPQSGR